MEQRLRTLHAFYDSHRIVPSPAKYQCMALFAKGAPPWPPLRCGDASVPITSTMKVLGMTLDSRLSFEVHAKATAVKARGLARHLQRTLACLPKLSRARIHSSLVLSLLEYRRGCGSGTTPLRDQCAAPSTTGPTRGCEQPQGEQLLHSKS
eukprot:TRINITY_DN3429_c0_g1_i10.p2 TRINITY_DN3429_c0_g1~~TRINITY_DN3429_c0_g1_i10.p2  ORF type:complete len:151 (+),score=8.04 TRINITY_DN3429_c0_g1_i10:446-898(+)